MSRPDDRFWYDIVDRLGRKPNSAPPTDEEAEVEHALYAEEPVGPRVSADGAPVSGTSRPQEAPSPSGSGVETDRQSRRSLVDAAARTLAVVAVLIAILVAANGVDGGRHATVRFVIAEIRLHVNRVSVPGITGVCPRLPHLVRA